MLPYDCATQVLITQRFKYMHVQHLFVGFHTFGTVEVFPRIPNSVETSNLVLNPYVAVNGLWAKTVAAKVNQRVYHVLKMVGMV